MCVHLSDDELIQFATGRVADPSAEEIEQHLLSCEHCASRIDNLPVGQDAFISAIRHAASESGDTTKTGSARETRRSDMRIMNSMEHFRPLPATKFWVSWGVAAWGLFTGHVKSTWIGRWR